ncbi:hypothetical protein B0H17DRAFT_1203541 [Mycena rosella]|uniref:F-box domain-containing protein n=1 Tax=Mycena rosella TaxID=1033263 RepID=A0AAD7DBY2_MYCRO|nr:hypothetical protein B0H17DRAFT_1203541 [Mycena rosella]
MLLTRRAHKAISQWLPNEIIAEIVQAAPRSDQASLCRVSKLFHDLCLPILYGVVDLEADASVADFGDIVLSNAALAGLVRSYSVDYPKAGMSMDAVTSFSPILVDSSKAFVRLEALSISYMLLTATDLENLFRWTFPHLVRCSLGMHTASSHWSDTEQRHTFASFLIRHPGLENLYIQLGPHSLERSSGVVRIPLLRLQQLRCPSRILSSIVAPGIKQVELYWDDSGLDEVDTIVLALKAMIPSDVPFICSNEACDKNLPAVVDSLSRNLPHTRTLRLCLYYSPMKEVIDHLKSCLPCFTGLAFLSVQYSSMVNSPREEEEQLNVLSDACPTLEACRLHHRAWRKVDGMWETYPLTDFDALAGLESWTL